MIFHPTKLAGAFLIELERHADNRGFFARTWCADEFQQHGLKSQIEQCNLSHNARRGTVRGMHFQRQPHAEAKCVSCLRGAIHDVIIDLRSTSPTYGQSQAVQLDSESQQILYIPEDFAHGFQTLTDNVDVYYQMFAPYHAPSSTGVRWNDPAFAVEWPEDVTVISEKDQAYEDYEL